MRAYTCGPHVVWPGACNAERVCLVLGLVIYDIVVVVVGDVSVVYFLNTCVVSDDEDVCHVIAITITGE